MTTTERHEPTEGFICIEEELWYQIPDYQRMDPFFMTIISPDDLWMYISSTGGLTCGRKNADNALFPYYPDDRVSENYTNTGSLTSIIVESDGGKRSLWRPFREYSCDEQRIRRCIAKHASGNRLRFSERELGLGLKFSYTWAPSPRWGWVRTSRLTNTSDRPVTLRLCDGVRNILPANIDRVLQLRLSTLTDAYKLNELIDNRLALYSITSRISDKAEANESLLANSAWQIGLKEPVLLLSEQQVQAFERGENPPHTELTTGIRGGFFVNTTLTIEPGQTRQWSIILEVHQDHSAIARLFQELSSNTQELEEALEVSLREASERLESYSGLSDGLQLVADRMKAVQHQTSTMYNIMRGGLPAEVYQIDKSDLESFLRTFDPEAIRARESYLESLPAKLDLESLRSFSESLSEGDALDRRVSHALCSYLPVSFSRRHGDPSRPWNEFSIELKEADGSPKRTYEGNWRDLFQNWEALALSFPLYLPTMITIFLNGITVDGYNPYKVGRGGYWWEFPDESDPWANIGYWNDHQGIYLFKLLELCHDILPLQLEQLATTSCLYTIDVPYRIRSFEQILADPRDTIDFDHSRHEQLEERRRKLGTVGTFLSCDSGEHYTTNLIEKLLIIYLVKTTNLVPEAGIWLNTQRPEWNDANNALVGWGCSVVTMCYLYRGLEIFKNLIPKSGTVELHEPTVTLLEELLTILNTYQRCCETGFDDAKRYLFVREVGSAGERHRLQVYSRKSLHTRRVVDAGSIREYINILGTYLRTSISHARREDGLYHGYTVLGHDSESLSIGYLPLMLEGQVAVISSGLLEPSELCDLLDSLERSDLYESRQNSYLLYPPAKVKSFLQINLINEEEVSSSKLLSRLLSMGDSRLVIRDAGGSVHFASDLSTRDELNRVLELLKADSSLQALVKKEQALIHSIYEKSFEHATYTGRSGRMFAYEGNGSIYWHMVSKLLVAVQEQLLVCDQDASCYERLKTSYRKILKGLGSSKQATLYGAFPFDAYSHTPSGRGARQPGLTGHVKEELLVRRGEMGIFIESQRLRFEPRLLEPDEFLQEENSATFYVADGTPQQVHAGPRTLAFTICGTPVVYRKSTSEAYRLELTYQDGVIRELPGNVLNEEDTYHIIARDGKVRELVIYLPAT